MSLGPTSAVISESGRRYKVYQGTIPDTGPGATGSVEIELNPITKGTPVKHIERFLNRGANNMTLRLRSKGMDDYVETAEDDTEMQHSKWELCDPIPAYSAGATATEQDIAVLGLYNRMVQATDAKIEGIKGEAYLLEVVLD